MTMHQVLNLKSDKVRIQLSRKEGGRRQQVLKTVKLAILQLERYLLTSQEGQLIVARRMDGDYEQHLGMTESGKEFKDRRRNEKSNVLKQKKLHGQSFNQIEEVAGQKKNGYG